MPGPGHYIDTDELCTLEKSKVHTFSKNKRFVNTLNKSNLGPGAYGIEVPRYSAIYKGKLSSVFSSKTRRELKPNSNDTQNIMCYPAKGVS